MLSYNNNTNKIMNKKKIQKTRQNGTEREMGKIGEQALPSPP